MTKKDAPETKLVDGRHVVGDIRGGEDEISDPDDSPSIDDDTGTFSSEDSLLENNNQDGSVSITEVCTYFTTSGRISCSR